MLTEEFSYNLPDELIASYPAPQRGGSRLLALNYTTGAIADKTFSDLEGFIHPGDLLVVNNSRVLNARLYGAKDTGGKIEILIERIIDDKTALVHIYANKATRAGTWLLLGKDIRAHVSEFNPESKLYLLTFHHDLTVLDILAEQGEVPLPPYMNRAAEAADIDRYQTVYSDPLGSIAAPTAGLHFNETLLQALQNKGVEIGRVTLHVGAGTFQAVTTTHIADHKMHSEYMQVSQQLCDQVAAAQARGGRVVCVGTTSVRALESAALNGTLQPKSGDTNIFITPGFKFKVVDALITNFHIPKSSLLMLVSALAGKDRIFAAYAHAIANKYQFYSYGDAMFIHSAPG